MSRGLPAASGARARRARALRAEADGRVQRGERSREAITRAMFALVGEGVVAPTAQQVAERADVGLRSVFRHFRDMETLHAAMDAQLRAEVLPLLTAPEPGGAVAARARALVALRVRLYERIAPYKRAANAQHTRSPFLRARHAELVARLSSHLVRWLPELGRGPESRRDAVELLTSFEAWDRLRREQRLSRERAQAAIERSVLALLGAAG